jgi:hypothetical protein
MQITAAELQGYIGRKARYTLLGERITFEVSITNARQNYGHTDVEIEPVAGKGRKWVRLDSGALEVQS